MDDRLNQIKSNDGFVVRSIQRNRPAAHYNNKIHIDKTLSSLIFTLKRTAKKVSLQLHSTQTSSRLIKLFALSDARRSITELFVHLLLLVSDARLESDVELGERALVATSF